MGLLGKFKKRQNTEDSEDLDFDDEMVDSLDMPGEEGVTRGGILGKLRNRRQKDDPEDPDEADEADLDDADQDEDPTNAVGPAVPEEDPAAPEEDSPVQVVRLEGIPDVHPVGDSGNSMTPDQEQTGAGPGTTGSAGDQPTENSLLGEAGAPDDPAAENDTTEDNTTGAEGDTTEDNPTGDGKLAISLQDIFAETQEVDESLRDLADFVEDALAQDLATELQEFLGELENRRT